MLIELLRGEISQEEYLIANDIRVVYKKLPKKIYGFIHKYRDINLIIINWNVSREMKIKTILHECAHFELHHLDYENYEFSIKNIEDEADIYVKMLLESMEDKI